LTKHTPKSASSFSLIMLPPGRRKSPPLLSLIPLLVLLLFSTSASAASGVLGIDLGTEYFKAALVKPGTPLEIVLTKDSKRKEAATVAFKPSRAQTTDAEAFPERLFGGDALALAARFKLENEPAATAYPWEGGRKRRPLTLFSASFPHPVQGASPAALNALAAAPGLSALLVSHVLRYCRQLSVWLFHLYQSSNFEAFLQLVTGWFGRHNSGSLSEGGTIRLWHSMAHGQDYISRLFCISAACRFFMYMPSIIILPAGLAGANVGIDTLPPCPATPICLGTPILGVQSIITLLYG
jgi:hypothetical protein